MALNAKTNALVTEDLPYSGGVEDLVRQIEALGKPGYDQICRALGRIQSAVDDVQNAVRQQSSVDEITVTDDETGELIAWFGSKEVDGVRYRNYLKELYIGGPDDPTHAVIFTDEFGNIYVGENGSISVLDAFGAQAARLGTWFDTLAITGAVDNGAGLIRLTVTGHTLETGYVPEVRGVGGVPNAAGAWTVTKIDADHVDLQASYFDGTYTSGGTIWRILKVVAAADSGALTVPPNMIRLETAVNHGYTTGDKVDVEASDVDGQFLIKVVDATHFDLVGTTWNADATGGTCLRYFGGGLFQTIAVASATGEWDDAKLRAQPNGDLLITNAYILLSGAGATIELDPTDGEIVLTKTGASPQYQVWLHDGQIDVRWSDGTGEYTTIVPGLAIFMNNVTQGYQAVISEGLDAFRSTTTDALSKMLRLYGYTGSTEFGPQIGLYQARGTGKTATDTKDGDYLGSIFGYGYESGTHPSAGMRMEAIEDWVTSEHGARIVFLTTPENTGSIGTAWVMDGDGNLLGADVAPIEALAGRRYITLRGTTEVAVLDLTSGAADANATGLGQVAFSDRHSAKRAAVIQGLTDGTTGNDRGGALAFYTRPDAGVLAERGRFSQEGYFGLGGNASPAYELDVTGDANVSGAYFVGGVPGIDLGPQTFVVSVGVSTATLFYKDHAGANQSIGIVTGVTVGADSRTWTKGILTA